MATKQQMADDTAKELGYQDAADIVNKLRAGVALNAVEPSNTAAAFLASLSLKVLKQEITNPTFINVYERFIELFRGDGLTIGNTKEYVFLMPNGTDVYNENQFIPTTTTTDYVESTTVNLLNPDGTLAPGAYRIKKPLTIIAPLWQQYFVSGKLNDFIEKLHSLMRKAITLKIFDNIMTNITTATIQKTITGTAANNFDAWTKEIFPAIEAMKKASTFFNVGANTKYATESEPKDIYILISIKDYEVYRNGTLANVFNARYAAIDNKIPLENIIVPAYKVNVGDSATTITFAPNEYVPDGTIYVFDKTNIVWEPQINITEAQKFVENAAMQFVIHAWGVTAVLPQAKMFKYVNPNLSVAPATLNQGVPATEQPTTTGGN